MLPDLLHVAIFRFPKKLNCKKFLLLNQLLLLFKVNGCNSTNEHAGNMLYHNRPQLFQESLKQHLASSKLVDHRILLQVTYTTIWKEVLNCCSYRSPLHIMCISMATKDSN